MFLFIFIQGQYSQDKCKYRIYLKEIGYIEPPQLLPQKITTEVDSFLIEVEIHLCEGDAAVFIKNLLNDSINYEMNYCNNNLLLSDTINVIDPLTFDENKEIMYYYKPSLCVGNK